MPRATLRFRTTVLATAITAVALVVGSVLLVQTLESRLGAAADDRDRSRVVDLVDLAASGSLPATLTADEEGIAQVVSADGRVLAASANAPGDRPIASFEPGGGLAVREVSAPDDDEREEYRLWAGAGEGPDGPFTVYVGHSLESLHEASATLWQSLLVGVPALLLLLALATWFVVGAALARVDRLRREVDSITDAHLDRRVPAPDVDDEVGRLAVTMNRMLERLEAARTRQREFVADVSHDLQSPLAAQRARLEVARAQPGPVDVPELTSDLLATTADLEHLVRDLLFLAATDAGQSEPVTTDLDLEDVALEEAARVRTGGRLRVETGAVSAAPARAARGDVQRIVRNLLDNAVAHARTTVQLRVTGQPDAALLDVVDDGPGVPAGEEEQVFDRFHRGDGARSRPGGSGLGLAIARTLAERNGGSLELVPTAAGAHFRLRLPPAGG